MEMETRLQRCRTAVLGSARASLRVTKRALGFASCMDRDAMDEELQRQVQLLESKLGGAVACAREEVGALGLETLSDPEAFLRFLAHDPLRAMKAAPIILQVYGHVPPAQRVLLFAKLMGLAAMVGAVLRGDERVLQAFEGPFPLNESVKAHVITQPMFCFPVAKFEVPKQLQSLCGFGRCLNKPIEVVIFHSYVSLPEGTILTSS
eukprot:s384_g13.t1